MAEAPRILLEHHLTNLKLPTFLREPWDHWNTIRRVNPLVMENISLRRTILRERDDARRDESQRPAFEAYRLNRQVDVVCGLGNLAEWKIGVLRGLSGDAGPCRARAAGCHTPRSLSSSAR